MPELLVDPKISSTKLQRELDQYRARQRDYEKRGWFLLEASFPTVYVVFCAPQLKPGVVVFGALLDFSNYDIWPPSLKIVEPFTREPYKMSNAPTHFKRRVPIQLPLELVGQIPPFTEAQLLQ